MAFPSNNYDILREYAQLILHRGRGESACMAVARFQNRIIASSNLQDIKKYCKKHKITYLTTMDFVCQAKKIGLWDIARCNRFITKAKANRAKLPCHKIEAYDCREIL